MFLNIIDHHQKSYSIEFHLSRTVLKAMKTIITEMHITWILGKLE
jgi:hypothetical protein